MPTYTYFCEHNDIEFEEFHSIMTKLEDCPICKEKHLTPHAPKRLISGGSGRGIVELTGNELVAKTKEDVKKMKHRAATDEAFHANLIGESSYQNLQSGLDKNKRR